MERGGTVTWYLDGDNSGFKRAARETQVEAAKTGRTVDREIKRGTKNASLSLGDFRKDLSRSAQLFRDFQIAIRGFQMNALIIGATTAAGAVVELGGALLAAGGSLAALPGLIAPAIGAFATIKTAMVGVGDAFSALGKGDMEDFAEALTKLSPAARDFANAAKEIQTQFKPIQQAVQEQFFSGLGDQIRGVANASLPALQVGLLKTAAAFNGMAKEAARVAQEPFFQSMIRDSLQTTADATQTLTKAVEPLAKSLAGLVKVGLPYTNMLAGWVVKQLELASAFINSENGQKALTDVINLGIEALAKLGNLLGATSRLLVSVFKVSNQEGLSFIDTLTNIINKVNDWVNTAEGQRQLTALFQAANYILVDLAETAGVFAKALLSIVEAFNNLPEPVKGIVTQLLIWSALMGPLLSYISAQYASLKLLLLAGREVFQFFGKILPGITGLFAKFGGAAKGVAKPIQSIVKAVGAVGAAGKGIGVALNAIFKPLASPTVLKGAASAALIGIALITIAEGINKVSQMEFNLEKMLTLAASVAVLNGLFALVGVVGKFAIIGAVASAAIGAALWVLAWGITDASKMSEEIKLDGLLRLGQGLALISSILALTSLIAVLGAIGAAAGAVIGVGLVAAAWGLAQASNQAKDIKLDEIFKLSTALSITSAILGVIAGLAFFGVVGSILSAVLAGGLVLAAIGLKQASKESEGIKIDQLLNLSGAIAMVSAIMAAISLLGAFSAIGSIISAVISLGVVVAAESLLKASLLSAQLKPENLEKLYKALEWISKLKTGGIFDNLANMANSIVFSVIASQIVNITRDLNSAQLVPLDKITALEAVLKKISSMQTGGIVENISNLINSGVLANIAKHVLSVSRDLAAAPIVDTGKIDKLQSAITKLSSFQIAGGGLFDGRGAAAEALTKVAREIEATIAALWRINTEGLSQHLILVQTALNQVKRMVEGFINISTDGVSKAATALVQGISSILATALSAAPQYTTAGQTLATKLVDGIVSKKPAVAQAGAGLQGSMWNAIQAKMQDEYYQGAALAQKLVDGLKSKESQTYSIGANAAQGFINGSNSKNPYSAGWQIADRFLQGLKARGQQGSPWKTTQEIGLFAAEGFAEGILDGGSDIIKAANAIVDSTLNSFGALDNLSIDANVNSSPQSELLAPENLETSGFVNNTKRGQVIVEQNNVINTPIDMEQVIRDMTWELSRA